MKVSFGWRPDTTDFRDIPFQEKLSRRLARVAFLLPNVDLRSGMPPVYDQGQLGSCTGNAIAAAIEYARKKEGLEDFVPSRLFIYYNERDLEGTVDSDAGAEIRDGIKSVVKLGACSEIDWSYSNQFTTKPTDQCYADARQDLVQAYARVQQTGDSIRACLQAGYPVVFGMSVYESMMTEEVAAHGIVNMPSLSETMVGGHAVLLCGYDDSTGRFLVRNSWGPGWGQGGYFTIPYDYILDEDLADDFWQIDVVGGVT